MPFSGPNLTMAWLGDTGGSAPPPDLGADFPWEMPSTSVLTASSKKVFAHWFSPFPVAVNDADPDVYETAWIWPATENGKYTNSRGFLRDRPKIISRPRGGADFALDDMEDEVIAAAARGIDGWTVDLLGVTFDGTPYYPRTIKVMEAAKAVPTFRIVLMPDNYTLAGQSPQAVASGVAYMINSNPTVLQRVDGKVVISPFGADINGPAWWQNWCGIMQNTHGIPIAFWPCPLEPMMTGFAPFSVGLSHWGARNPGYVGTSEAIQAHGLGKMWMQPVGIQDYRNYTRRIEEAANTEYMRKAWEVARTTGSEWVQIPTWNDYSEHAHIQPSEANGTRTLDLMGYFIAWFKTGVQPPIVRDALYLSHRVHPWGTAPSDQPARITSFVGQGGHATQPRDTIEVLSFLTAADTITITAGSTVTTYSAPAGMFARTVPLQAGTISAETGRGVEVVSGKTVVTNPVHQNLMYYYSSSEG